MLNSTLTLIIELKFIFYSFFWAYHILPKCHHHMLHHPTNKNKTLLHNQMNKQFQNQQKQKLEICVNMRASNTNIGSPKYFDVPQLFTYYLMATNRTHGSFVPFTLHLDDDGHVSVSKDLLSLRFNFHIGTTFVEQKIFRRQ